MIIMNKEQLIKEIMRVRHIKMTMDFKSDREIAKRYDELMMAKGYERTYMNKNEKKSYLEDVLECWYNAFYDCRKGDLL